MRRPEDLKKPAARKITLSRETLRQLTETELQDVAGQKNSINPYTCTGLPACVC